MRSIRTLTVACLTIDGNKEKPGSFDVRVLQGGGLIYKRDQGNFDKDRDDGTTQVTARTNIGHRKIPSHGSYALDVPIDPGDNMDMDAAGSITVMTSVGQSLVSNLYRHKFEHGVRSCETNYSHETTLWPVCTDLSIVSVIDVQRLKRLSDNLTWKARYKQESFCPHTPDGTCHSASEHAGTNGSTQRCATS